jgi:hypothetical protein
MGSPLGLHVVTTAIVIGTAMKTLTCDLCEHKARGATFEEWMQALMPHYMEAHADVMQDPTKGEDEKRRWMAENRARFDAA